MLHIQQGLDSLDELFNALLDISRIDSETLQINKQHFLLGELINKCTDQYSIQATTKHLKLNVKKLQLLCLHRSCLSRTNNK